MTEQGDWAVVLKTLEGRWIKPDPFLLNFFPV